MSRQVIPDNPTEQLAFFQAHIDLWEARAGALGLSAEQLVQLRTALEQAESKRLHWHEARNQAAAAADGWHLAAQELRRIGGNAVRTIKTHAVVNADPSILTEANIDPPERPGPRRHSSSVLAEMLPTIREAIGAPTARGTVELTWRAPHAPQGTFYQVHRRLSGGGPMRMIAAIGSAGAGRRKIRFEDADLPAGLAGVEYLILPCRGGVTGQRGALVNIAFGRLAAA